MTTPGEQYWPGVPCTLPGWQNSAEPITFDVRRAVVENVEAYTLDALDEELSKDNRRALQMLAYAHRMAVAAEQLTKELAQEVRKRGIGPSTMAKALGKKYPSDVSNFLNRWPITDGRRQQLTCELEAWTACTGAWYREVGDWEQDDSGELHIYLGVQSLLEGFLHLNEVTDVEDNRERAKDQLSASVDSLNEALGHFLNPPFFQAVDRCAPQYISVALPSSTADQFFQVAFLVQMAAGAFGRCTAELPDEVAAKRHMDDMRKFLGDAVAQLGSPACLSVFDSAMTTLEKESPDVLLGSKMSVKKILLMYKYKFGESFGDGLV